MRNIANEIGKQVIVEWEVKWWNLKPKSNERQVTEINKRKKKIVPFKENVKIKISNAKKCEGWENS